MSTKHWVEVKAVDGEVEYDLICGDPGACSQTVEESRHLGCAVKDYWNDMGTDLLSVSGDPVQVGRFEVTCEWNGYGPDAELYLHPVTADGDSLEDALGIANAATESPLGAAFSVEKLFSPAQAVEEAVRALWAAGYRRTVPPEQPSQEQPPSVYGVRTEDGEFKEVPTKVVPPESAAIAERMSTFMAEAAESAPLTDSPTPTSQDEICRRTDLAALSCDLQCPDCGHWPMAHTLGRDHQTPNDECQICLILALTQRFTALVLKARDQVAEKSDQST